MGQRIDDEMRKQKRKKIKITEGTDEEIADEYGFPDKWSGGRAEMIVLLDASHIEQEV